MVTSKQRNFTFTINIRSFLLMNESHLFSMAFWFLCTISSHFQLQSKQVNVNSEHTFQSGNRFIIIIERLADHFPVFR